MYYTPIIGLNFHAAYTFIDANITSHTMVTNPANPKGPKKDIFGKKLPFVSPHQFILDASYTYAKTTIGLSSFFYSRAYTDVLNTVPFTEYAPTIKNGAITTKTAGMTPCIGCGICKFLALCGNAKSKALMRACKSITSLT
ncbi:hypothetical protein HpBT079_11610 [Helicobacter pylori]